MEHNLSQTRQRIDTIDIIRGVGILLVILGHLCDTSQFSRIFIYSFHMPLFFFFSGVLSNPGKSIKADLKKAFKSLYLPFAVFTLLDLSMYFFSCITGNTFQITNFLLYSLSLFSGISSPYKNVPIWFLFSLFLIKAIFILINKIRYSRIILLLILIFCVVYCFFFIKENFAFNGSLYPCTIISAPFFIIGYWLRDHVIGIIKKATISFLFYFSMVSVLLLLITNCLNNVCVDIHIRVIGNPSVFFINAFLGIGFCLLFGILIDKYSDKFSVFKYIKRALVFFGKYSIYILVSHCFFTNKLPKIILNLLGLRSFQYEIWMELLLFILTVLVMIPVCLFCDRFLFFIFGKPKKKH